MKTGSDDEFLPRALAGRASDFTEDFRRIERKQSIWHGAILGSASHHLHDVQQRIRLSRTTSLPVRVLASHSYSNNPTVSLVTAYGLDCLRLKLLITGRYSQISTSFDSVHI